MVWVFAQIMKKNAKPLTNSSKKVTWLSAQIGNQAWLAHHFITHWIQMNDISRAKTTYKGVVTENDVGLFSSDQGEKRKTFDQQHQKSDLALHRLAIRPG
jgi:hypothetical protein